MVCEVSKRGTTVPELRGRVLQLWICSVLAFFAVGNPRLTAAHFATLAIIWRSLRILAYSIEKVVDERGFEPPASSLRTM